MKAIYVLIIGFLAVGCSTPAPKYIHKPVRVEIPVIVPCRVKIPPREQYATDDIGLYSTDFEKIRSLLLERRERAAVEDELRALLGVCLSP